MAPPKTPGGDPRRPGEVKKYPKTKPPGSAGDILTIAASACGVAGMLMKSKLGAWGALFCCLANLAHMRSGDLQNKHILTSCMFAVFCLFSTYRVLLTETAQLTQKA